MATEAHSLCVSISDTPHLSTKLFVVVHVLMVCSVKAMVLGNVFKASIWPSHVKTHLGE